MRASPFVVSVSDLVRRDGSSRRIEVEAPVEWAVDLSEVLPDPPLTADLQATEVSGGVLFRGTVRFTARHTCHRCLVPTEEPMTVELAQLFTTDADDADSDYALEGTIADLEPMLRDEVLLAMPLAPTCADECDLQLVGGEESDLNTDSPTADSGGSSPFAVLRDLLGD